MEKRTKFGTGAAYLYLLLPFIIFVLGWIKLWIAVPMVLLLGLCFFKMLQHGPRLWRPELNRNNIEKIVIIVGTICLWVYLSGIGRLVFQNTDHSARNAIFNILVEHNWPVLGTAPNDGSPTGLIYYIGFWLPSAVIGKIFGLSAGYWAQDVWAVIGILLVYYFICVRAKKLEIWPLLVLIFFSGLDYLGTFLLGTDMRGISQTFHLEWWDDPYQISSMTTQLFWVFNQCIPAWLATALLMNTEDNRCVVMICAMTMLTSTLPFVGLLPIAAYFIFSRKYPGRKWLPTFCKDTFTLENVVGGGIIGIVSFLYLSGNMSGSMISTSSTAVKPNGYDGSLLMWLLCIALEVGVYLILIYKRQRNNILYYIIAAELCFFPLLRVGTSNDFNMRAIIPAQFILLVYVTESLRIEVLRKKWLRIAAFVLILGIGAVTPVHEITRTCAQTIQRQRDKVQVEESPDKTDVIMKPGNFAGLVKGNIFYEYLAKKNK